MSSGADAIVELVQQALLQSLGAIRDLLERMVRLQEEFVERLEVVETRCTAPRATKDQVFARVQRNDFADVHQVVETVLFEVSNDSLEAVVERLVAYRGGWGEGGLTAREVELLLCAAGILGALRNLQQERAFDRSNAN